MPHKIYGELKLVPATVKTYILHKDLVEADKWTHYLTVYDKGSKGCLNHYETCKDLMEKASKKDLSKFDGNILRDLVCQ